MHERRRPAQRRAEQSQAQAAGAGAERATRAGARDGGPAGARERHGAGVQVQRAPTRVRLRTRRALRREGPRGRGQHLVGAAHGRSRARPHPAPAYISMGLSTPPTVYVHMTTIQLRKH